MTHELKIEQRFFDAAARGVKPWELRVDDREPRFEPRDFIRLREIDERSSYTGREILGRITFVLRDHSGLSRGWCLLTYEVVAKQLPLAFGVGTGA